MHHWIRLLAFGWICLTPSFAATPQDIEKWVHELGSDFFAVREQAWRQLVLAGPDAVAELSKHVGDADLEVARRSQTALEEITSPPYVTWSEFKTGTLEALRNAATHSGATEATLVVSRNDGTLRLVVADRGHGFDPRHRRPTDGLGILGMRERAAIAGGTLTVSSRPGEGTTVDVAFPMPAEGAA